ncbi:MAG: formamidopyrimidine-DNA glycosylase [Actinobacteria bacterium]|nr:MAG: formamidopyrimidine-DNA glycosylase [Actinomycetota bacterium]
MPEGDAVRQLATTFNDVFAGSICSVSSPQGRFAASAARIDGWRLETVEAHGKHMFMGFVEPNAPCPSAPRQWVHIHLGLYGTWRFTGDPSSENPRHGLLNRLQGEPERPGPSGGHRAQRWSVTGSSEGGVWTPPAPVGQVRLRIVIDDAVADVSGPNRCELISDDERLHALAKLGPDPLVPGARDDTQAMATFVGGVRRRRRAIGELMMDQSVIAGVGNIYRADILFLAGISPMRRGDKISKKRAEDLWRLTCDVMNRGFAAGRLDTMDPEEAPREPIEGDEEASRWYVYHRTGRPCLRCGTPIAEKLMQNRRLFWCPQCQR